MTSKKFTRKPRTPEPTSPPHDSARTHVSGGSEFVDDRPFSGDLHVGLVWSPHAHARITKVDSKASLRVPGVVGVFTAHDLIHNRWGTIFQDQPILADDMVLFAGEPVAAIAAETRDALELGKREFHAKYQVLKPTLTIDEAKAQKLFIGPARKIERGDVATALRDARHRLRGRIVIAGQDHFYLESQACIAYPGEAGQIEVHSSSQHPTEVQHAVAHALGLPFRDVVCVVKRMGGAFGGKESQATPFAAIAALVAQKTGRPARLILTKDDDMVITGKRNPFQNDYDVGFDDEGRILALDVELFSDGGAYADLSTAIMERAMLHSDNAYFIPNARIRGQVCKTHHHPHTAFRGFGGPKGVATIESIIEDIAHVLKKDALEIRKLNCYRTPEHTTPYGQPIENNMLPALFDKLEVDCEYARRRAETAAFNRTSTTHLRGLSLTAVKFGISFTTRFLNQGAALVNAHLDGTIQVSTGATEMGQGVNTRIAQVVAECFGIPYDDVRVMPTSTEKIPNTSPTAASSGADINAAAALRASEKIRRRLALLAEKILDIPEERRAKHTAAAGTQPEIDIGETAPTLNDSTGVIEFKDGRVFSKTNPAVSIAFAELLREAYLNRIALGDSGFFKYPGIHYNKVTGQGRPFFYFTQGVAASEVEIDRWTGELKVKRVDILMDLGRPINRGLDIGQTTGGFVQGMGWVTTEKLHYENGFLVSHSPSTYKIPNIQDTPRVFNVDLIENLGNTKNIGGSKAVGEPPLLLGVSVWTAVKDALHQSERFCGSKEPVALRLPATHEEIFTHLYPEAAPDTP